MLFSILRAIYLILFVKHVDNFMGTHLGCTYLAGLLQMFGGSLEQALAAYNAGDSRVKDWLSQRQFSEPAEFAETIPFRETRVYVQTVLRDVEVYRQLMTGEAAFAPCEDGGARQRQPQTFQGRTLTGVCFGATS